MPFLRAPTGRPEKSFGLVNDFSGDKRAGWNVGGQLPPKGSNLLEKRRFAFENARKAGSWPKNPLSAPHAGGCFRAPIMVRSAPVRPFSRPSADPGGGRGLGTSRMVEPILLPARLIDEPTART